MCEILYNIILGKVNLDAKKLKMLKKHKNILIRFKDAKSKLSRRKLILNQKGGFLPFLIPLIGTIASKLFA